MENRKISYVLYQRYEYLAKKYANRVYNYEELSYEYDDLLQEMKIKIFTSIKAYGRRWYLYRQGSSKPVHIKYYIESALSNKVYDLIKAITRENHKLKIDEINYDFGSCDSNVNPNLCIYTINGVDLLEGLSKKDRIIFVLFLKGYPSNKLGKVYKSITNEKNQTYKDVIERQKKYLMYKYSEDLLEPKMNFETYKIEK